MFITGTSSYGVGWLESFLCEQKDLKVWKDEYIDINLINITNTMDAVPILDWDRSLTSDYWGNGIWLLGKNITYRIMAKLAAHPFS